MPYKCILFELQCRSSGVQVIWFLALNTDFRFSKIGGRINNLSQSSVCDYPIFRRRAYTDAS